MIQQTFTDGTGARDVYTFQMVNGVRRQIGFERFEPVRETFRDMRQVMNQRHGVGIIKETQGRTYRNQGCCVIFSMAYATGQHPHVIQTRAFQHNYQLSKDEARDRREYNKRNLVGRQRVFTGTVCSPSSLKAMAGDGWRVEAVKLGKTVGQAQKKAGDGMYLLEVRRHLLVLDDGCLVDWKGFENKKARRLEMAWKISKI
jgi:hypothetical protein